MLKIRLIAKPPIIMGKLKRMTTMKEMAMEMQENQHLADLLGITDKELTETDYEIKADESEDGLVYNYRVEFDMNNSPNDILQKIRNLEDGCRVYLQPWELNQDYDYEELYEEQYEAITGNKEYLQKFRGELSNLKLLNELALPDKNLKDILTRQLYISVIGTMETFLSDAFINLIKDEDKFFRNFIVTHPAFKKQKFELRDIFEQCDKLKKTAKDVMLNTIYHNLPLVREMFKNSFDIDFPPIEEVFKCVSTRHDLVHRNGKTKDGTIVEIDENAVYELIEKVSKFVEEIANKLDIK